MYTLAEVVNNNLTGISYIDSKFLTSFSNSGSLDPAKAIDFGTPNDDISPEGIWYLEPDVQPTGGDYTIKLHYDDGGGANAFSGLVDNQFGPLKRDVSSTSAFDWSALNGSLNANGGTGRMVADGFAQRNGITSFSHFAIGRASMPLPVELLQFTAMPEKNSVILKWTTSSEINNDYFTVERSVNAVDFKSIGNVYGAGNSAISIDYSFVDNAPYAGISYYRLRQTDFNGYSSVSRTVSVEIPFSGIKPHYYVFHNNSLTVFSNGKTTVDIFEITGKRLIHTELTEGMSNIDLSSFPTHQIYLLQIKTEKYTVTDKFFR
jgi:hypothetical protein